MAERRYDGTDPDLPGGWIHEDGSPCPEYLAPDDGTRWWCSEHEKHLTRPGTVVAYLSGVRKRSERPLPHVTSLPIGHDGVRSLMESAADIPRLLAAVEAVLALAAKHEHGATRWEDPLPVPTWIPQLREAISRALLGETDA